SSGAARGAAGGSPAGVVARIQVGSYRDAARAEAAARSMAALGLAAVVEESGPYRRVALYVRAADRARVEAVLDKAGWKDRLVKEIRE
ncbi:MAG: SPOR domain-containing protein, partial [Spirochaetes bacterium]|nr:SPOR domain-containing protein [Spirochaetota bacterium]